MSVTCRHLPSDLAPPRIESDGCEDCLAAGRRDWLHLRFCQECGHVGCCDNSPGRHATAHFHASQHPLIRSFEPGEDGTGRVVLTLAGDGAIRLSVEALELHLRDVTRPYSAPSGKAPDHGDG